MNIILCGMPTCGKTYYGKLAAQQLKRSFIDTDDLVMKKYSERHQQYASCRQIAQKHGRAYFYELEKEVIKDLMSTKNSIIAVGGGTLCCQENIPILKKLGWILYLKTPKEILMERILKKEFLPSYLEKDNIEGSFDQLLTERLPLYEQNCHCSIEAGSDNILETITFYAGKENNHG